MTCRLRFYVPRRWYAALKFGLLCCTVWFPFCLLGHGWCVFGCLDTCIVVTTARYTTWVIHGRCKIFLFQHRQTLSFSAMKMELRLIKPFQRKKHCKTQCKNNIFHRHAKKKNWESEDEKDVMFISSMVLQWIMTFSTYQQKMKKKMKPQFQWEKCWTHFWPSMEKVNLSFFCADKLRVYPRRHWYFHCWNPFKGRQKTL